VETVQDQEVRRFVGELVELKRSAAEAGRSVRVTWLNHYSARVALREDAAAVTAMDVVGVDGLLLKVMLGHPVRTSADLVVPALLQGDPRIRSVLAVGGHGDRSEELARAFGDLAGRPVQVTSLDGYGGLLRGAGLQDLVRRLSPDLVLVGLGAGLQERVVLEIAEAMTGGYAMTCGGFCDQVLHPQYYPRWAYPLRLNWLVRLAREPRRLWRRYTVDAVRAIQRRQELRRMTASAPGLGRHAALCGHPAAGPAPSRQ
jgi:beta-1,4-glucosyltransferase